MEIIVFDLEKFSTKKLNVIIAVELLITLISLLVIYYEFKKVFLPILKKLSQELVVSQSQFEELKQKEVKILKQNKTLRQIAWQQSHEVRQPVVNILGIIDVIKTDKTLKPEEQEQYLTYLFQATQELDRIIHKIVAQSNENELIVK
jgi:light-regulated signal transduction histidine kinase (bacteriophytochrome)